MSLKEDISGKAIEVWLE